MINSVPVVTLRPLSASFNTLTDRLGEFGFICQEAMNESQLDSFLSKSKGPELAILPLPNSNPSQAFFDWIKVFQSRCPDTEILAVFSGRLKYNLAKVLQSGVGRAFLTPFEDDYLLNRIFELIPMHYEVTNLSFDHLHRVSVFEFDEDERVPFDIYLYLPFNRKVILYLKKDQIMDEKMRSKFKNNMNYNMYINRANLKKYLHYTSEILKKSAEVSTDTVLANSSKLSTAKLAENLSFLMKGFFSEEFIESEGTDLLENFKTLTSDFVGQVSKNPENVKSYQKLAYQKMTHQTHAANVAAYCCLFGSLAGLEDLESLQLGGLLHDIGLADMPEEILGRSIESLDEDEKNTYLLHPGSGKMTIEATIPQTSPHVLSMVLYHHEQPSGEGYPYKLKSEQISDYAKICSLADEFDKLTSVRAGYKQLSPHQAMLRISGQDGQSPSPYYDPNFHGPIVEKFLSQLQSTETAKSNLGQIITESEKTKAEGHKPSVKMVVKPETNMNTIRKYLAESKLTAAKSKSYDELNSQQKEILDQVAKDLSDHFARISYSSKI